MQGGTSLAYLVLSKTSFSLRKSVLWGNEGMTGIGWHDIQNKPVPMTYINYI